MRVLIVIVLVGMLSGCASMRGGAGPPAGMKSVRSPHDVKATIDRLEAGAKARGLTVFARIDHADGAKRVGKNLRPTELLIFGNPQGGTPLMECAQTLGIDLPLKALAWRDASGAVWLGYAEPRTLVDRHVGGQCQPAVDNVTRTVEALVAEVVRP
jgi:uncharacterized protein (DUF302 family)